MEHNPHEVLSIRNVGVKTECLIKHLDFSDVGCFADNDFTILRTSFICLGFELNYFVVITSVNSVTWTIILVAKSIYVKIL